MKSNEYKKLCEVIAVEFKVKGSDNPVLNYNRIKKEHDILTDKVTTLKQKLAQLEKDYLEKYKDVPDSKKTKDQFKYVGACSSVVIITKMVNQIFD